MAALERSQRLIKSARKGKNRSTSQDHPNFSIAEIGQNTENSPGDPRRNAVSPVNVGKKTRYVYNNNNNNNKYNNDNRANLQNCGLCCFGEPQSRIESK